MILSLEIVNRWRFELVAPPSGCEDDRPVPRDHPHLQESHVRRLQDPLGSGQLSIISLRGFILRELTYFCVKRTIESKILTWEKGSDRVIKHHTQ